MKLAKLKMLKRIYFFGNSVIENDEFINAANLTTIESNKTPYRYEIINYLLSKVAVEQPVYLEIGVRNPAENYDKINCAIKYSVDPGIEFKENPVDYKITSDEFFKQLSAGTVLKQDQKFDVIFIDGLHLADQVERDILNALNCLNKDGFIVLHDCNPPTEYHARENHNFRMSPALNNWNGTVWKALFKMRFNKGLSTCCIDADWGVGVIMKNDLFPALETNFNPFFEYSLFDQNRKKSLNLISFESFRNTIENK